MVLDAPEPGSHDRSMPSGVLEESSLAIFEAMLAARDAEASGEGGRAALDAFYRTLMNGTLLLPVPPEHGDEAKSALEAAVNDDEEVEVSVLLAADADGRADQRLLRLGGGPLGLVAARHGQPPAAGADRDRQHGGRRACRRSWIRPARSPTASSRRS